MFDTGVETTGLHTFTPGVEACVGCHDGATDFDMGGQVTVIEGLLSDLGAALLTAGMVVVDAGSDWGYEAIEDTTYQADSVGALWNWVLINEDMSMGIHNPAYAKAILAASISKLQ
jgi:hypothetical protein